MNEEEGEWFGRHDHPLLNHVILENFFEYVRRCDLLECRGVSRKWNELAIPFTRSKFTIDIPHHQFLNNHRRPEKETRKIEDFVAVFSKNTLGIPFGKFNIESFHTTNEIGQLFLKSCGDTTTEIHLWQYKIPFKVEDVSEILRSMKKLEKMTISAKLVTDSGNAVELFPGSKPKLISLKSFTWETESDGPNKCSTLIEELITAAENISDLTLGDCSPSDDADNKNNSNSFRALTVIEKLGRESSVQSLTLGGVRVKPHVELLRRLAAKQNGLKLKKLKFSMDEDEKKSDNFHLVELFRDTLEDLDIFGSSCSSFINLPKMRKLRRLNLKISKDFDSTLVNLDKIFPILKELELCPDFLGKVYGEFFPQSEPCLTMKSLRLGNGLHLRLNAFDHVLTIFPRLTKLKIDLEVDAAEILRIIWTQMTQLESLHIWGKLQTTESIDSLFCGISTPVIQKITGVLKYLDKSTVQCRRATILNLRNQHCQLPSIGNLTNLRCLELNVSRDGNGNQPSYLSDVTGFLGFYSLKHLTHLAVLDCELTKTCCKMLTTEMEVGLESWRFVTPELESIIPHPIY